MILGENIGSVYSTGRGIKKVYSYGKLVWEWKQNDDIDYSLIPFTVKAIDDAVSVYLKYPFNATGEPIKYSINEGEWIEDISRYWNDSSGKAYGGIIINLTKNDTVSILTTEVISQCIITGLSDVYGNIMSLLYSDDFIGKFNWKYMYNGKGFGFFEKSDIVNANNLVLPATHLKEYGYDYMFKNCYNLITAPELPAKSMLSYCYRGMFDNCYNLITAPELPATSVPYLYSYLWMFRNCSKLNYIKCYATDISDTAVSDWLKGVNTNGTLVCKRVNGGKNPLEDYIPSTWTVEYMD